MDAEELKGIAMSRRSALKKGAATAFLLSQAALLEQLAAPLVRPASAATTFSDIQFDMGAFINPAQVFNDGAGNVTAQFAPTYALLQPVTLNRTPTKADQPTCRGQSATRDLPPAGRCSSRRSRLRPTSWAAWSAARTRRSPGSPRTGSTSTW